MKNKLVLSTLRNTVIAAGYIFLVSQILNNGDSLFGNVNAEILGPFIFLLLFVVSAAIVSTLIFGQAVILFFEGKRADSIKSAAYSIGWLLAMVVVTFVVLLIANA